MKAFILIFGAAGAAVLLYTFKKLKLRYAFLSALSGIAAFFAADFICSFFDFQLPLNGFSIAVSAIGGVPGVILINLLIVLMR